ncbi:hypothetical protein [Psychroserpens sp. SPM9]|uniref:hypothetical protein n=1 Tax=Psychroserpens sp. SPM9 TaxID=2975598 RepID=UPI0021A571F9|nr:hypothetical protein [Psychroserpens sp. SPM9]MDG5490599.1 hypothetical protein [Psychroserpens sp. SPM9]
MTNFTVTINSADHADTRYYKKLINDAANALNLNIQTHEASKQGNKNFIEGLEVLGFFLSGAVGITMNEIFQFAVKRIKKKTAKKNLVIKETTREIEIIDIESGTKLIIREVVKEIN